MHIVSSYILHNLCSSTAYSRGVTHTGWVVARQSADIVAVAPSDPETEGVRDLELVEGLYCHVAGYIVVVSEVSQVFIEEQRLQNPKLFESGLKVLLGQLFDDLVSMPDWVKLDFDDGIPKEPALQ